jgi:hypothetical protein
MDDLEKRIIELEERVLRLEHSGVYDEEYWRDQIEKSRKRREAGKAARNAV